ncbi:MAG TPA: hypothetical protein VK427_08880 [Kofleriaceae bacterium]|nr:hypothetical protein [Kofleriaceae bacterium]
MRVAPLLLLAACGSAKEPAPTEVRGSLSIDGKPLAPTACRVGRGVGTYAEVVTAQGKLRFEDKQLFWTTDAKVGRGETLACDKLERSWGGGMRTDGTAYFRGHLIFTCTGTAGAIVGDLELDCGGITAEERAQLDKSRVDVRCQQLADRATKLGTDAAACATWLIPQQDCLLRAEDKAAWDACFGALQP